MLLLVGSQPAVVALGTAITAVFSEKTERSLPTLDTTLSQDGPRLPCGADVGSVPVWNRPNSDV